MSLQTVTPSLPDLFPQVRGAIPEDFPQLMALCGELYQENGQVKVDWSAVESKIVQGIRGRGATIGVIGVPNNIEAMIYLQISNLWYSGEAILEELYNYVSPDYRSARRHNARALLEFAKSASNMFGVPLMIGVISTHRTKGKIKLYEKVLGPMSGAFFLYRGVPLNVRKP